MKKKRAVTLIEIMIVILLIGLIGGALAFNMRGSMDQGRAFKTEQGLLRIHDILMLEAAKGEHSLQEIATDWKAIIQRSPLVKGQGLLVDAWNRPIEVQALNDDEFIVSSPGLTAYRERHAPK